MDIHRRKAAVATLSVASNTLLILLKVIVGIVTGSVSVVSEAIHSGVDLVAAIIALLAVRAAAVPADKQHPFGHGKVENISGAVEALLIFVAAGWIIYEAVGKILHPRPMEAAYWGVAVMLVSAVVNIIVSRQLFRVGEETGSVALQADAWHLRTDVYTSVGVMGALAVIVVGERLVPSLNLQWMDPVVAIAVAMLILKAAWHLTAQSIRDLLDVSLPQEEQDWIMDLISSNYPVVCNVHGLRTRKAGNTRFVELHLVMHPNMSVEQSHAISHEISDRIRDRFPDAIVTAHIEPCDGRCGRAPSEYPA
ncbi:MAG: cation diffusion facilitator family transporter [Phycisphaerae bacterium]|jgi:cation diffusion facilitator family transporter